MLTLKNVSKSFGEKRVLDDVNFSLGRNERVGLVGKNGSGKTTIFRIIVGDILQDGGSIQKDSEILGYLPQYPGFNDSTVADFLESLLENRGEKYKTDRTLNLLGLSEINRAQKADSLSGGQKTRLYLASLLLSFPEPTTLLLDEPTNNLDLEGLVWLERFLQDFKGSVLLTSHDRYFLDNTLDRILELEDGMIRNYGGGYSFYKEQKLLEEKAYLERYKNNVAEIKRLERLIIKKRERIKKLAKDKGKKHEKFERGFFRNRATKKVSGSKSALESRLQRTDRLEKPKGRISYSVGFGGQAYQGKLIIEAKDISKHYNGKTVLDKVSLFIVGSQHVWLSGSNGSGKTTLLNILVGRLKPEDGKVRLGDNVKIAYFSQDVSGSNPGRIAIDELRKIGISETECYKQAIKLHLEPADLRKPVSLLSRGQITKLEFAKLLLEQNNLLILDEPTNHLEIDTREEIEEALKEYQGAILVASHDRYFLEEIGVDRQLLIKGARLREVI